jgi:AcrR family transcriptional regulator
MATPVDDRCGDRSRDRPARVGRRSGSSTTRAEIVSAARALFAELGYERTTLRAVAAQAGVNQALIYHFFRSKDELLSATLDLPMDPRFIVAALHDNPGREGAELMRRALAAWRNPGVREHFQALLRAGISHDRAAEMVRNLFTRELLTAFAEATDKPDAALRAALVGSQIAGIAMLRFMIGVDALTEADDDTIVNAVGPTLQRYLTGDLN